MRTLVRTAVALGFIGATAIGTTVPVMAQGVYFNAPGVHIGVGRPYHRHYYDYYGGGGTWNGCPLTGPSRVASVSRIVTVLGTSMEGGGATTDINICGGRFGGLLFLACLQ